MASIPGGDPNDPGRRVPPGGVSISVSLWESFWNWITGKKTSSLDPLTQPIANLDSQLHTIAGDGAIAVQEPTMSTTVPQTVLDLIREREGCVEKVYVDTTGNATAGIGHEMLPSELHQYPEGSAVPDSQVEAWFASDTSRAYSEALMQARLIGNSDERLIDGLACVCFQLGGGWYKDFPKAWKLLVAHQWTEAAAEVAIGAPGEPSDWMKETPVRVKDFQTALRSLNTNAPPNV